MLRQSEHWHRQSVVFVPVNCKNDNLVPVKSTFNYMKFEENHQKVSIVQPQTMNKQGSKERAPANSKSGRKFMQNQMDYWLVLQVAKYHHQP